MAIYDSLAKRILFAQKNAIFENKKKKEKLEIERVRRRMKTLSQKKSSEKLDIIDYYYNTEIQSVSRINTKAHQEFDSKIDQVKSSFVKFTEKIKSCQKFIDSSIYEAKNNLKHIQDSMPVDNNYCSKSESIKQDKIDQDSIFTKIKSKENECGYNIMKEKHQNHMSFMYNFNENSQSNYKKIESRNSHVNMQLQNNLLKYEEVTKEPKQFCFVGQSESIDFEF